MIVTRRNFAAVLPEVLAVTSFVRSQSGLIAIPLFSRDQVLEAISAADFVAIDTEFSGLQRAQHLRVSRVPLPSEHSFFVMT